MAGLWVEILGEGANPKRHRIAVARDDDGGGVWVAWPGGAHYAEPEATMVSTVVTEGAIVAPMTGKVIEVAVAVGDVIEQQAPLVTLEAMKMEHHITAPHGGRIKGVYCASGDSVDRGAVLIEIDP